VLNIKDKNIRWSFTKDIIVVATVHAHSVSPDLTPKHAKSRAKQWG
jgi:hypothetical protein